MSATAREVILGRIRDALAGAVETPPAPRAYRHEDARDRAAILDELVDRLADYKARVTRIPSQDLPAPNAVRRTGIRVTKSCYLSALPPRSRAPRRR